MSSLYFRVVEARALKVKSADPYCKVKVDKLTKMTTDTLSKTNAPVWKEKGRLFDSGDEIVCKVGAYSQLLPDSTLGVVKVKMSDHKDGLPRDSWYKLTNDKGKEVGGELRLQIMYVNSGETVTGEDFSAQLQTLMRKNKFEIFKNLLDRGGDLESRDKDGNTPLHVACELGHAEEVALLLKKGASVSVENDDGFTPLHCAAMSAASCINALIDAKADVEAGTATVKAAGATAEPETKCTPAHVAAWHDQGTCIAKLKERGAKLDARTSNGNTPLHLAVKQGKCEAITALILAGADVYKENQAKESCVKMCLDIPGEAKTAFKKAAAVEDDREFDILRSELSKKHRFEGEHLEYDWKKSQQVLLTVKEPTKLKMLIHFIGAGGVAQKMAEAQGTSVKLGFLVVRTDEGKHHELSYHTQFAGYGTKIYDETLVPEHKYAVIPFAQEPSTKGKFSLVAFTEPKAELSIELLEKWKHVTSIEGEWSGESAAGSTTSANKTNWKSNPQYVLELPKDKGIVTVYIMLAQRKSELDLIPYQVMPYPIYIGFYVYNTDLDEKFDEAVPFKNAQETYKRVKLDTSKETKYIIMPATHEAGQETTFTITVACDEKVFIRQRKD